MSTSHIRTVMYTLKNSVTYRFISIFPGLIFILCLSHNSYAVESIIICGTGDSQELLHVLADSFENSNPGTKIVVPKSIGSSGGIRATSKGDCHLGRTARLLKDDEKQKNLKQKVFAYSLVVFAANPYTAEVENITTGQVIDIFSGNIRSWADLGGKKLKIYVANREKGDSSRSILEQELAGFGDISKYEGKIVYSTPETAETIRDHKGTIGYIPLSMAKAYNLHVLKFDGVSPTVKNAQDGSYKYLVPFSIIWKGTLNGTAKRFVQFLLTQKAQQIIEDQGASPADSTNKDEEIN